MGSHKHFAISTMGRIDGTKMKVYIGHLAFDTYSCLPQKQRRKGAEGYASTNFLSEAVSQRAIHNTESNNLGESPSLCDNQGQHGENLARPSIL